MIGWFLKCQHIDGSNNILITEKLGWAPSLKIKDGLHKTYTRIKGEMEAEGGDTVAYSTSEIVQQVDDSLMQLGQGESTTITEIK